MPNPSPAEAPEVLQRLRSGDASVLAPAIARVLAAAESPPGRAAPSGAEVADVAVRATGRALGVAAAQAGLTPDHLFALLDDAVRQHLREQDGGGPTPAGAPPGRALGLADAVVLLLWGAARHAYHDTRAAIDVRARRTGVAHAPVARASA